MSAQNADWVRLCDECGEPITDPFYLSEATRRAAQFDGAE